MNRRVSFEVGGGARLQHRDGVITIEVHDGRMSAKDARRLSDRLQQFADVMDAREREGT